MSNFPNADSLLGKQTALIAQAIPGDNGTTPRETFAPPLTPVIDNSAPAVAPAPRFQTVNYDGFELHRYPGVSDTFMQSVEQRLQSMPAREKQLLRQSGLKISVTDQLNDADPNPEGPFEERGGRYLVDQNEIIFSQRQMRIYRENAGARVGSIGAPITALPEDTMYHEWGHALNESMRIRNSVGANVRFSDSNEFADPYTKDLQATYLKHRRHYNELHYYVSDHGMERNRNEAFAEMYVLIRGKGDPKHYAPDRYLPKDFKDAYDVEKRRLDEQFSSSEERTHT